MSLAATFNSDLYRVQLSADDLGASAEYAVVERSVNEDVWETVRGGKELAVDSQEADLDDYEYPEGVQVFYRITSYDSSDVEQEQFTDDLTVDHDGDVILKSIRWPMLNRVIDVANWSEITRRSRSGIFAIKGRSTPVAVHDKRASREFTLTIWTDDMRRDSETDPVADAAELDLILAAGGTYFVHVPDGSAVPGGYVSIGDTSEDRVVRHGTVPRRFNLPCTVVTPPGPEVTGGTLTWGTVERLYGSWSALLAEHSTWSSLLAEIGDPDDLVVL